MENIEDINSGGLTESHLTQETHLSLNVSIVLRESCQDTLRLLWHLAHLTDSQLDLIEWILLWQEGIVDEEVCV